jgi:predicted lipoprotein
MTRRRSRPWLRALVVLAIALCALAVLRPWTVRPIRSAQPKAFDPVAFADAAWPRVLAQASSAAVDVRAARQAAPAQSPGASPARRAVFVTVTGTVTAVDRHSRVGLLYVRAGDGATADVTVQIGPVLRGTALRDATGFIRFGDFGNQFEYAAVSNALNDRVLRDVVGPAGVDGLTGATVSIVGATTLPAPAGLEILPVRIERAGGAR